MDVSEESLLDYFYSAGGKVKNADLLKTYKPFIGHSDLQLRAKYREEFKVIIDRIAVVKSENGEKYLVLKKKYRQLLQEREPENHGTVKEGQGPASPASPASSPATVLWEGTMLSPLSSPQKDLKSSDSELKLYPPKAPDQGSRQRPAQVMWDGGPTITVTGAPDQEPTPEEQPTEWTTSLPSLKESPAVQLEDLLTPSHGEDDHDKDSGSKSESEQDEDCMGNMGSTSVALEPVEKEWIYSAACGRSSDLSQLLRQDPSLANKKDFTSFTALHWAAKHGKEDMTTLVANAGADVNIKSYAGYTPLHIAALHGHRHILDLLIQSYGAKENIRDYSGHLACYYLNIRGSSEGDSQLHFQTCQAPERRNRKLASLFQSKKKWGSAEELAPIEEERSASHQLMIPAFRTRKFSR
ncbi:ankyrin repeat domain-containing protein SOWAHB isoform X1 [Hypomesus transpacificus]|uniref:ankyrin repeat domain-containing protein SOWAHB isoform X1 n=1 Tax=Hypomesus transpacificus TaxID=137520 RepID=UPI001F07C489|nr:ankyrin repeat domain-containing protein SOWAHB isoform X1 [Hypomesus transpacificus]